MRQEDVACVRDAKKAHVAGWSLVSRRESLEEKHRTGTAVEGI